MKRVIGLCCLLLFLVSCQPVQVHDSSHITEEEVVSVLQDYGVSLVKAKSAQDSIFGSRLNHVNPGAYQINEKFFYIYEYTTEIDRQKGMKEFKEKTATMNLVSFLTFEKRNILIFYVHGLNLNSDTVPFEKEIQEALDSMIEG